MSHKVSTSVIHICGAHTDGELILHRPLLGQKVVKLFGGRKHLTALTFNGLTDILSNEKISDSRVLSLSFGISHSVAVMANVMYNVMV
jgi:hypothetical protein